MVIQKLKSGIGRSWDWTKRKAMGAYNATADFGDRHHVGIGRAMAYGKMAWSKLDPIAATAGDALEQVGLHYLPESKMKTALTKISQESDKVLGLKQVVPYDSTPASTPGYYVSHPNHTRSDINSPNYRLFKDSPSTQVYHKPEQLLRKQWEPIPQNKQFLRSNRKKRRKIANS